MVGTFDDKRKEKIVVELLVKWKSFLDSEEDWVSYSTLKEDVP